MYWEMCETTAKSTSFLHNIIYYILLFYLLLNYVICLISMYYFYVFVRKVKILNIEFGVSK